MMEDQIGDLTTFLKGMQAWIDGQHDTVKKTLEVNTAALQDLSMWKPKVQADVEKLQTDVRELSNKLEHLSLKHEELTNTAYKVFDERHLDLSGHAGSHLDGGSGGNPIGLGARSDEHGHWGLGNGVVTTFVPSPVTGAKPSRNLSPVASTPGSSTVPTATPFQFNHAIPPVDFPEFDGSCPKLWIRNCESYFDVYSVPDNIKSKLASMRLVGNAAF
jgi:hypothetical protein